LALENEKNVREKEAAAVLAESERLRANLLRTISHDLRTPLTSISGNASNLMSNGCHFDEETKQQLYKDIYEDSMWLISLVENLLSATRIEEGQMKLRTSTELLGDIVEEAVSHISRKAKHYQIAIHYQEELILVCADTKLVVQVLVNLLDNAIKYTPSGSEATVRMSKKETMAQVVVADNGMGIPDEEKNKIFDMFYCGGNKIADNRRSLGLGLYLCKAIIEAHGGTISVSDHVPHGAEFCFTLPLTQYPMQRSGGEVTLHEQ
jgi:two-component system sensor histidine kinase KdpD